MRNHIFDFEDGDLTIEVSNVKSLWGVRGNNVTETSDHRYVEYDGILPVYEYVK